MTFQPLNCSTSTMISVYALQCTFHARSTYRGADKSLAQPGRKQATVTEDFDFHITYL